uniref:Uncharacterized protein n=1 Tax=Plectus sambesii TaxID=2011161 RepID=A0A914VHP3_9BILA
MATMSDKQGTTIGCNVPPTTLLSGGRSKVGGAAVAAAALVRDARTRRTRRRVQCRQKNIFRRTRSSKNSKNGARWTTTNHRIYHLLRVCDFVAEIEILPARAEIPCPAALVAALSVAATRPSVHCRSSGYSL